MTIRDTDIKAAKAEVRRTDCLHCVLMDSMEDWLTEHAPKIHGKTSIDVSFVSSKLMEVLAEVICTMQDRSSRRRAVRFSHDALDAAIRSQMTGRLVEVDCPAEN